jgi:enoyl-[acyl-carrier protein] reductase/trans-2-enoyl-CoA reductase (NAD+)
MIIQPKMRGFISTSSHPEGSAKMVEEQVNYVKANGQFKGPPAMVWPAVSSRHSARMLKP